MAARPPILHDAALQLACAVIRSSVEPTVMLDAALTVVCASDSFMAAFGVDPETVDGLPMSRLGAGEWSSPQLGVLLAATATGESVFAPYEMDFTGLDGIERRLVLNAHKLEYGDGPARLVLTIQDITEARATARQNSNLLREKDILLQEIQHRVANSLQIIASVLLQSARKVQTDESRGHLTDAHNRVMSVAAVQKQLSSSTLGDVALDPYFKRLSESLAASMIHDPQQIALTVDCDDSRVASDISVSLGLIVTELVINALKHAFPGHRKGHIEIDYKSRGPNWTLTVRDDGVGMSKDPNGSKPGLGTSIVEAVANQLGATVQVTDGGPGTTITVAGVRIGLVDAEEAPASARSEAV